MPNTLTSYGIHRHTIRSNIIGIAGLVHLWSERRDYRRQIARLLAIGPHMIKDVGLTVGDALKEVGKPFWRD